ncbi:MAG: ice-binding family protein [Desulfobulbaceae bacterium]
MNTMNTSWLNVSRARWMLISFLLGAVSFLPLPGAMAASPLTVDLLSAESFAALAGTTVTCTGGTINGDVGVSPGSAFVQGGATVNGTIHLNDAVAIQAQADLTTAYNDAAGRSVDVVLLPLEIGGMTLVPNLYRAEFAELNITGNLTFDGLGDPNAVWIIQTDTTVTQAGASNVILINGAQAKNIFWKVGSSATLGTYSTFKGNILAHTSITINTATSLHGSALAINGAVTFNGNSSTSPSFDVITITASAGAGGTISPIGPVDVTTGSDQTFIITPDPHYKVGDVLVDGVSVGEVPSYTFFNVTEPHTIAASFSKFPWILFLPEITHNP